MKINLHQHSSNGNRQLHRRTGSYNTEFTFTQAIIWFILAAVALCLFDTSKAQSLNTKLSEAAPKFNISYNETVTDRANHFTTAFQYSIGTAFFSLLKNDQVVKCNTRP